MIILEKPDVEDDLLAMGPAFFYPNMTTDLTGNHATLVPTAGAVPNTIGMQFAAEADNSQASSGALTDIGDSTVLAMVRVDSLGTGVDKNVFSDMFNIPLGYYLWALTLSDGVEKMTPRAWLNGMSGTGIALTAPTPIGAGQLVAFGFRTRKGAVPTPKWDLIVNGGVVNTGDHEGGFGGSGTLLAGYGLIGNAGYAIGWDRSLSDEEISYACSRMLSAGARLIEAGEDDDFNTHNEEPV